MTLITDNEGYLFIMLVYSCNYYVLKLELPNLCAPDINSHLQTHMVT